MIDGALLVNLPPHFILTQKHVLFLYMILAQGSSLIVTFRRLPNHAHHGPSVIITVVAG